MREKKEGRIKTTICRLQSTQRILEYFFCILRALLGPRVYENADLERTFLVVKLAQQSQVRSTRTKEGAANRILP